MKLTDTQIQNLYKFTKQHYVEYYDLQTELVDHLANDIETMWLSQPQLSYEGAKNKAFKKFGVFRFMSVIEKHQKTMSKRYRKYLWRHLKEWFEIPQIITTVVIFVSFYTLFSLEISPYIFIALLILIGIVTTRKEWITKKDFKKRNEKSSKKWLLQNIIFQNASSGIGIFFLNIFSLQFSQKYLFFNEITILMTAFVFTFMVLWLYVSCWVLPKQANQLLNETYPEYNLA